MLLFSSWIWSVFLFTDPCRIGKQFELTLLLQSVVMIITMFGMLHLCCTVQNTNRVSTKQHRLSGEDSQKSVRHMTHCHVYAHHFFSQLLLLTKRGSYLRSFCYRTAAVSLPSLDSHLFSTHLIFIYLVLYSTVILCLLCIYCICTLK